MSTLTSNPQPITHNTQHATRNADWRGLIYVAVAVFFFSTSPVLIRWAEPLHPFVKTGGRLAVAALALALVAGGAWAQRRGRAAPTTPRPRRVVLARFAAYGAIAALHFFCYITALI